MRKSRISKAKQLRLMEYFVAGTTARCASSLVGINKNSAAYSTCIGLLSYGQAEYMAYLQTAPQTWYQWIVAKLKSLVKNIW